MGKKSEREKLKKKLADMFDPDHPEGKRYREAKKKRAEEGERDYRRRQHIKESMERRRGGTW